jgi:hypothetical protein
MPILIRLLALAVVFALMVSAPASTAGMVQPVISRLALIFVTIGVFVRVMASAIVTLAGMALRVQSSSRLHLTTVQTTALVTGFAKMAAATVKMAPTLVLIAVLSASLVPKAVQSMVCATLALASANAMWAALATTA